MTARPPGSSGRARGAGFPPPRLSATYQAFPGRPRLETAVVLLSNAIHPTRRLVDITLLRAGLHRAVRRAIEGRTARAR